MNKEVTIRIGEERDAPAIADFNIAMAKETEGKELDPQRVASGVRRLIANPQFGFYLVAKERDRVVGCLMITMEWSDWRDGFFWWVQSVYVHERYRRQGIYRKLYEYAKSLAVKRGSVCGTRLYVERENISARRTYENLGMLETRYKLYEEEFPRD